MNKAYRMTFEIDARYKEKMILRARNKGLNVSAWIRTLILQDLKEDCDD